MAKIKSLETRESVLTREFACKRGQEQKRSRGILSEEIKGKDFFAALVGRGQRRPLLFQNTMRGDFEASAGGMSIAKIRNEARPILAQMWKPWNYDLFLSPKTVLVFILEF